MGVSARVNHRAEAPAIPTAADFRARVRDAVLAVEAALLAAEMLATHGVVESLNYERLIDLLQEAGAAVHGIDADLPSSPTTVFPSLSLAEAFVTAHPLDRDQLYQINRDGIGRCTIAVFRLIAHL